MEPPYSDARDRSLAEARRAHAEDNHQAYRAGILQWADFQARTSDAILTRVDDVSAQLTALAKRTPTAEQFETIRAEAETRKHWAWVGRGLVRLLAGVAATLGALVAATHIHDWLQQWRGKL